MAFVEGLIWALGAFVLYRVCVVFYRLFLHPLCKFPGPRIAASTTLYRAYYQVIRDGDHIAQATRLHEFYGPVVRVAPNTLHFRDPKAFDEIFKFTSKLTKDPDFYDHLGQSDALFGLVDENVHKDRFKLVADLFSKKFSQDFEPNIHTNANRLCDLFLKCLRKGGPVNVARGLRAVALDIVQDFVFDFVPDDLRGLKDENFDTLFVDTTWDVMDWTAWCFRNFPLTLTLSNQLPQWLRTVVFPGEAANIGSFDSIQTLIKQNVDIGPKWHRDSLLSRMTGKVTLDQLTSECQGTMFGGVINLANMLPFGVFSVCNDLELKGQVYAELKAAWSDPNDVIPAYSTLTELPFLSGVVKESLRLMHGILVGPPRVVPNGGVTIRGHFVPPKSVVTTSSYYVHMNPEVFPNPAEFRPQRWFGATPEMERSLVAFSKGRRMCPGKEISIMELFIVFAAMFRRFDIVIHDTTKEDFEWKVYVSLHFLGRFFHAHLTPRPGYAGAMDEFVRS